jgi:solute carrier family 35 protein E2
VFFPLLFFEIIYTILPSEMVEKSFEVVFGVVAWYLTSFGTLLLNKYLLGSIHIQPNTLAVVQMTSTAIYGALKTLNWRIIFHEVIEAWKRHRRSSDRSPQGNKVGSVKHIDLEDPERSLPSVTFKKGLIQMGLVGAMRFATVVLGLVSLKHIAASFTETVKASAPFFTVVIAYLMLGERTSWEVVLSLVPVAGGLVMVSFSELSFNVIGFSAAVATNVIECVQNVFSKRLLARDYTPQQLQFYTSLTALALQAPMLLLSQGDEPAAPSASTVVPGLNGTLIASPSAAATSSSFVLTRNTIALLWVDGVLYHLQSVVAYVVMSHLSPVTVSVINTLKRALLIWISVLVFGNEVTHMAQLGTAICLLGTLGYNYLRQSPTRSK